MADRSRDATWPSATTRFVGVIGDPVYSSRSPLLHNTAFAALDLDVCYGAFLVRHGDVGAAIAGARALSMLGLSVTMPHKQAAARASEQRSPEVEQLDAANTIVFRAGVSVAYNTDGAGFIEDLEQNVGLDLAGLRVALVGAGGAARALVVALGASGASEVVIVNRDPARAASAAALHGVARVGDANALADAALIVNATPLGMTAPGALPTASELEEIETLARGVGVGQLFVDLVTSAPETAFMAAVARRGAQTRNGIGMLVHQAVRQFELFTGERAPVEAMWAAVSSAASPS